MQKQSKIHQGFAWRWPASIQSLLECKITDNSYSINNYDSREQIVSAKILPQVVLDGIWNKKGHQAAAVTLMKSKFCSEQRQLTAYETA